MIEATNSRYLSREVRRQAEKVLLNKNGFLSHEHTEALDAMTAALQEHMVKQHLGVVRNVSS